MLGLGQTTDRLARYRRKWQKFLALAKGAGPAGDAGPAPTAHLAEVEGFGANPGNLRMLKYVPERLPDETPLVVVLHGCTQTACGYDRGTGWSALAERAGFAVLFPEQRRANNPNTCFTWFSAADTTRDQGEALSIRQMIERMVADHGIDKRRIYVTGLSAGGAMASVMLATYPEIFAGGAIVAGLPYGSAASVREAFDAMFQTAPRPAREWGDLVRAASAHAGPWPRVSVWHGSADPTVKPSNADEIVKQWADVHGLAVDAAVACSHDGHAHRVWRDAKGRDVIESYTIAGMAHGVPIDGKDGQSAPFILDAGISSTARIAQFWGLAPVEAEIVTPQRWTHRPAANDAGILIDEQGQVLDGEDGRGQRRPGRLDPGAVITKALKAAGLMK